MYPVILDLGFIKIYSFGLMMGLSFLLANYLLNKELKRVGINPEYGNTIILIAMVAGISGSKIFYLFENFKDFISDPIGLTFSGAGLTFYGGFLLATLSIYIFIKNKKLNFLQFADLLGPILILAYGVARIGCHLAGDGDYGTPTNLPWGTNYENGVYPPSIAFRAFPEINSLFSNGIVPDNTLLHPTPIYEFLICSLFFYILWRYRIKVSSQKTGKVFMWYLVASGVERFLVEFLRLNERLILGLSEAQIIALILIVIGATGIFHRPSDPEKEF